MTPDWSAKHQGVPYAVLDDPQSLNLYGYVRNDPLKTSDLDGHGKYYSTDGKELGSDGVDDGSVGVIKGTPVRASERTIDLSRTPVMYSVPAEVGNALHDAFNRSNSPSTGNPPDMKGGFHEEGFTAEPTGTGIRITNAAPGPAVKPTDSEAHVNLTVSNNTSFEAHVHPAGTSTSNTFGGTQFKQEPSDPDKANTAKAPNAVHIVVGAQSGTVYFYNAKGTTAQVPLSAFPDKKKN